MADVSGAAFEDWLAIVTLKARYCRLLDTKDWDGWADVFTEDYVLDTTGSGGYRIEGRAAAIEAVRGSIGDAVTAHHVHNPEIEIDGDTASAIWAMQDRNVWPDGRKLLGFGHYTETYRRGDGEWRIATSALTRLGMELEGFPEA